MDKDESATRCLNCGRPLGRIPLLPVLHRDGLAHICPQCLPVLIHDPKSLADKLPGADSLEPPAR
jgi:hypothetical protein